MAAIQQREAALAWPRSGRISQILPLELAISHLHARGKACGLLATIEYDLKRVALIKRLS
jgi:hypothetical protein